MSGGLSVATVRVDNDAAGDLGRGVGAEATPGRLDHMATKDTGGQKRTSRTSQESDEVEAQEASDVAERKEKLDEDIDAILDEIDEALEENSEEFVRGFIQKGGE
jgi:ubiquitin-like protein Pup